MNIKQLIKNSKDNDVFVKKINSEDKEFDGRYLLLIRAGKHVSSGKAMFRLKITKDKLLPDSTIKINEAEYIIQRLVTDAEAIDRQNNGFCDNKKLIIDDLGYLYVYRKMFMLRKKGNYLQNFEYVGNFDIELPKDEYIEDTSGQFYADFWEDIDDVMIQYYKKYNQKDLDIFNDGIINFRRKNYLMNKMITEETHRETQEILAKHGAEIEAIMEKEPDTEESLTYVGEGVNVQTSNGIRDIILSEESYEEIEAKLKSLEASIDKILEDKSYLKSNEKNNN